MTNIHIRFLQIAVVYLVAGSALGIGMGLSGNHQLFPAHAHINLVGWVSFALYGLIYRQFPAAAASPLARWHFWLANAGALVLVIGITGINSGNENFVPLAGTGAVITLLGALVFGWILFRRLSITD